MVEGKGKGEAEVVYYFGGDMVLGKGEGEGAKGSQPDAKRTRVRPMEDEGNETMNERIDARSVLRTTGMRCTDVIGDEDQIESMELHWIEQAETVGTCALCGCCVDESGGCLRCQIVRLPVNEGSEAVVEAAVEAVVEGAVKAAEDRHASEVETACEPESEPAPEASAEAATEIETLLEARDCRVDQRD